MLPLAQEPVQVQVLALALALALAMAPPREMQPHQPLDLAMATLELALLPLHLDREPAGLEADPPGPVKRIDFRPLKSFRLRDARRVSRY